MNSYDYLMNNLQEALKRQIPLMKSRVRKRKIKELYERYNLYRPYKFNTKES